MSHKPVYGADELHFPGCKPAVRFKLAFPDGEGRMGWGTKGPKQIRLETFSLFLVKLPPSGEVAIMPMIAYEIIEVFAVFHNGRKGCSNK